MNGSRGYSQEALRRLETGTYRGRKQQYRTSEDQVKAIPKKVPALEGMTRSPSFDQTGHVDTANARRKYEQRTNYRPIGRTLSQRDRDVIYNGVLDMFNSNLSVQDAANRMRSGNGQTAAGMTGNYVRNKNWEKEYGKSLEQLIEESARTFNEDTKRRSKRMGEDSKVGSTLGTTYLNAYAKPMLGAKAQINTLIDPDSEKTRNSQKVARAISDTSKSAREGVTENMGKVGKGIYDFVTPVADRLARRATLGKLGHVLTGFGTAEDKREELEDRGITGRKGTLEGLGIGAVDAGLDFYGLEMLPALRGLRESGNAAKMLLGGAGIGGGEQALTSLINLATDRIANRDKSINAENVRNYMSQGLSKEEAEKQAFWDDVKQVAIDTGSGALFGAMMQVPRATKAGLDNFARRYYADHYIIDPDDPILNDAVDTSDLNEYAQDLLPQNSVPMLTDGRVNTALEGQRYPGLPERQLPAIQLPGTNGTIELPDLTGQSTHTVRNAVRTAAESTPQNPRIVKSIEEVQQALKEQRKAIREQGKKYKEATNKKTKKAEYLKYKEMQKELPQMQNKIRDLERQANGLAPISDRAKEAFDSYKEDLRKVGNMYAGENGKTLAKEAIDALEKYERTGVNSDFWDMANKVIALKEAATESYTSQAGNTSTYNTWFNEEDGGDLIQRILPPDNDRPPSIMWQAIGEALTTKKPEVAATSAPTSNMDVPHQIAERYASSFQDFDTYDYMDNVQEMDGIIERMADDISTGKDLTPYIAALEDNMYNAPDESTAGEMQALIDELTALQNGSDNALSSAERAALLEGIPSGEPIPDDVYYEAPGVQALRRAEKAANSIGDADSLQKNIDNQKIVRMADAVDDRSSSPLLTSDNGYDTAPSESLSNVNVDQNEGNVNNNAAYNGYWLRLLGDDNFLAQEAQQTGVEPEMLRQYAMANMGYGDMPSQTPPPANNIPHMNGTMPGDNMKTSQTYTNTGKNAEGWTEEEYNKYTDPSQFQYESIDEEESVRRAADMRQREGREGFKERMMNANKASGAEIDGLMMEWRELGEEARALEAAGQDASDIWHESVRVFRKIQQLSTESAQGLQALAKWSRNTPEGMLADAENIINGKKKGEKNKLQEQLDKLAKQNKKVEFSESFVVQFLKEAGNLQGLDPDSREAREIMAKLGRMVNSQLPATFGEKLTSFLMDNMLGNFRTLITRNAGGNVGLNLAEQILQRPLAAGIDSLLSIKTGQRTQAGLTKEGLTEYIQGFAKGLKDEALDYSTGLHTSRTGQNTLGNAISSNRHVFKNKIMDRLDNLVKQGLSVGDRPFYEAVYNQTIGDYNRLRQRGVMSDDIQNLSAADFKLYSRAAAELNALAAVYQQDTTLSKALLGFKSAVGDLSRGILGVDILSQFSMPFVKTPANVIERAIDYSPLGGVRNAFRTHKERKSGTFDQNRFANETARNILGTALMGGGVALAANGLMSGAYSDDKDEKQAQRESGMQEYALNMGDKQMDIGWIPVVGSNNVAAAAAYDAFNNGEGNVFENAATGLKAGGQALFDQSMFQGLQRLFGTGETYNTDEGIVGNMANVVKQGLGQGIPSLFRQAGQVIDPYQRDVAYSNEGKSFGFLDNYDLNSLANNVPFLREQVLAPKVATTGELLEENQGRGIASKIFEDMILPGKVTKVEYSKLNEEAKRLKDDTTSADAYMPKAIRKNVDTEEHTLTNKEWSDYEQRYYKELTEVGTKILDSDFYKDADSTTQVKTLKNAYDAVKSAINSEYNGKEIKGAAKKYVEAGGGSKGVDAVVKYYRQGAEAEELGVNANTYRKKEDEKAGSGKQYAEEKNNKSKGISTSYKVVGKGATTNQAVSEETKTSAKDLGLQTKTYNKIADKAGANAEKVYKAVPELQRNGLGTSSAYYTYADALKVDPNLSSSEFAKTFNAIDADNSKGIKQDELIDYFNQNKYSQQQADRMWKMYGDSTWKKVPALVNGSFVKK